MQRLPTDTLPQIGVQNEMAVSIRRATIADVLIVAELGSRLLPRAHRGAMPAADLNLYVRRSFSLAQVTAELNDPKTHILLAEHGQQVAGMVKISPNPAPVPGAEQRPSELSRLYLNPQWIGRGVGAALIQKALKLATASGYDLCWLVVWTQNHRAQAFYRNFGFSLVDHTAYTVGQSQITMCIMARDLTA